MKFTMQEKRVIANIVEAGGYLAMFISAALVLFCRIHTLPSSEMVSAGVGIISIGVLGHYMANILSRRIRTPSPGVPLDE
jgi:hypothetical protein